jgi:acyl-CoA thioesterase-1
MLRLPLLLGAIAAGCGGGASSTPDSIAVATAGAQPAATSTNGVDPATPAASGPPVVLFIGTSLTAGLGLDPTQAFPARIGELAQAAGTPIRVVNAGLSGETSAGALRRADWVLGRTPAAVVVLETGANDGLRAVDPATVRDNLDSLVAKVRLRQPEARVVLVQMEAPPNLGAKYARAFRDVYPTVAEKYGIPLVPFLLEGVAGKPELNQGDGIHPTVQGARVVAKTVWTTLQPIIRAIPHS